MKKIFVLFAILIASVCYAEGDIYSFMNYKISRECKNYFSIGHTEVKKNSTMFTIQTEVGKNYAIFLYSDSVIDFAFMDGGFSTYQKYYKRGVFKFKAENKCINIIVNSDTYTQIDWGTY